jgi:ACR3 family arsenite efflux pump ArsB
MASSRCGVEEVQRHSCEPESGAALARVVGVLIEVPVMLSVCSVCNRTRHWFPAPAVAQ